MSVQSVLVVGGGRWQIPLIEEAHQLSLRVVSTGPFRRSPAASFADHHEVADARDWASNLEVANRFGVDAVVTDQTDVAVPTVAAVAEFRGLPGITLKKALTFTNKFAMRAAVAQIGMNQPEFSLCRNVSDAILHAQRWGFPVVIKPVDGQSSRGVFVAGTRAEIFAKFTRAQRQSTTGLMICENFLAGSEFTVEGFASEGRHFVLAISEKTHLSHNTCVAEKLVFRQAAADPQRQQIANYVTRLIEALELPFGLTHTEVIVAGEDIFLVETAARGGGTLLSSLIAPTVSGFNAGGALLKMALGERVPTPLPTTFQDSLVLQFFTFPPGRVGAIEGVDQLSCMPDVLKAQLLFEVGDQLAVPQDDSARHMFVIARGKSGRTAAEAAQRAFECVKIIYADG